MEGEKENPVSVLDYHQNIILHAYLLERKKIKLKEFA
jgi:hypothetical protein